MLYNGKIVLLTVLNLSGISCQFLNCNWVSNLDCKHYTAGVMCASNGQSYANRCYLAKAQCVDHTLLTVGPGSCSSSGFTAVPLTTQKHTTKLVTTTTTSTVATTHPISDQLRTICDSMSNVHCAKDIEPVCGSDGRTYINSCEFHIEVCQQHDLTITHIGFC